MAKDIQCWLHEFQSNEIYFVRLQQEGAQSSQKLGKVRSNRQGCKELEKKTYQGPFSPLQESKWKQAPAWTGRTLNLQ